MFIGKYYHTVEQKGRVSLPKQFRETAESWIITRGLDGGLFLFTEQDFHAEVSKLAQSSFTKKTVRDFTRIMTNEAQQVQPDANGRILISQYLLEFAGIKKEAVIVGSMTYVEIWDRDTYHTYLEGIESQAETLAETIYET